MRPERAHAGVVDGVHDPGRRRQPLPGTGNDGVGDPFGIERGINFANHFGENVRT